MVNQIKIKDTYTYRAFGINIASEIQLPELFCSEGEADVHIGYGKVPNRINNPILDRNGIQLSDNELLFFEDNAAGYYVSNGNNIVVQPEELADDNSVKLYLLGTALGTLLLQRSILPIHGSAVVIDGKCIIFSGFSGAGKSTLASAFRKKGCSFLSDDISVVTFDSDGVPWVQPGYPQQKLCKDSLIDQGYNSRSLILIDDETDKYAIPVHREFLHSPVRLSAIFELCAKESSYVKLSRITGIEKVGILVRNIYRVEFLQYMSKKHNLFKQCLEAANHIPIYRLARPEAKFTVEEQINLILKELQLCNENAV